MEPRDRRLARSAASAAFVLSFAHVVASCGSAPACPSSDQLRSTLAGLSAGTSTSVDSACVLTGSFTIPAGATLHGGTFDLSTRDAITLVPSTTDAPATSLDGARIVGNAQGASVLVEGSGHARIASVDFAIDLGIAVGVSGASVAIDDVTIVGTLDEAQLREVRARARPEDAPNYGIAVVAGGDVTISGSDVSGMANAGLVCTSATMTVSSTVLHGNRNAGALAFRCTVSATDVEITGTLSVPTVPVIGLGLLDASTLTTGTRLSLHDAPGYGVFAQTGAITLVDPTITSMGQAGIWVEDATSLSVSGGTFDTNAGAAIAAVGVESVDVHGTHVSRTASAPIPTMGGAGAAQMADALHLVQRSGHAISITLADLVLTENGRVGIVVDGAGDALALDITTTRVETSGTELGVLAQHVASLPSGWDSGVTRVGSAVTGDASAPALVVSDGLAVGGMAILMPPTISF